MDIYNLLYHLKKCPEVFLKKWDSQNGEQSQTEVLVKDIYRRIYGDFNIEDSKIPNVDNIKKLSENHVFSIQIGCWLFSYPEFKNKASCLPNIHSFLFNELKELCKLINHRGWIEDDDRAEEFIRLALRSCNIIPDGETAAQALDRLDALDTIKRQEVLRQTNESIERIHKIRQKMAEEKAREAANVYGRD